MTTILTAMFGAYDELRPQTPQDIPVRWVAVVDRPTVAPIPWEVVEVEPVPGRHPRMGAKWWRMFSASFDDDVIWLDANMETRSTSFAREALDCRAHGMAVWRHPHRDCIFDEARASIDLLPAKYAHLPLLEQVESYRAEGYPEHAGLYANGTIAWDWRDPTARLVALAWWEECERWTYQDQLSLPVVCRRLGIEPGTFPFSQVECRRPFGNRWVSIHAHLATT